MTLPHTTLGAAYFEALYASDPNPWKLGTSPYEAAKYAATLATPPRALRQRPGGRLFHRGP